MSGSGTIPSKGTLVALSPNGAIRIAGTLVDEMVSRATRILATRILATRILATRILAKGAAAPTFERASPRPPAERWT